MTETSNPRPAALSARERILLVALGLGLAVLLATAARLKPDPSGRGTHQQLGLPPCTFLLLFGKPCPACGMTTSWAWLVRGDWKDAFRANIGGTLLGMAAIVGVPWLLISAVRGRWVGWHPLSRLVVAVGLVILLVTLIQWGFRLISS